MNRRHEPKRHGHLRRGRAFRPARSLPRPEPARAPLGVDDQLRRRVACACGWEGRIADLESRPGGGGLLGTGPDFPGCPRCRGEDLEALDG